MARLVLAEAAHLIILRALSIDIGANRIYPA